MVVSPLSLIDVSIHAPVRERLIKQLRIQALQRFNSRSREGATSSIASREFYFSFNSRSREGATTGSFRFYDFFAVSIHAPVRERRVRNRH